LCKASPEHFNRVYRPSLEAGFAKFDDGKSFETFDIAPSTFVVVGDDVNACRAMIKPYLSLYVGGMGAKGKNFYNTLACRYGFEAAAETIQNHYLAGNKQDAIMAVPDELVDAVSLCGPKERIKERLETWKSVPVTTLNLWLFDLNSLRLMAELVL